MSSVRCPHGSLRPFSPVSVRGASSERPMLLTNHTWSLVGSMAPGFRAERLLLRTHVRVECFLLETWRPGEGALPNSSPRWGLSTLTCQAGVGVSQRSRDRLTSVDSRGSCEFSEFLESMSLPAGHSGGSGGRPAPGRSLLPSPSRRPLSWAQLLHRLPLSPLGAPRPGPLARWEASLRLVAVAFGCTWVAGFRERLDLVVV